jgi:SAM-dependent methyltransferase
VPQFRKLAGYAYQSARERAGMVIDRRQGIETALRVSLHEIGLAAPGRIGYTPSPLLALRRALRERDVTPEDVLLDIGCGKGRVLVQATRYPFGRVIGVEIAPDLFETAKKNLSGVTNRRCGSIELVCSDILDYEIPDDVTVVYMYNPFRGPIFQTAMARIVESLDRRPRRLTLIYRSPFEHDAILATGRFRVVSNKPGLTGKSVESALRVYELSLDDGAMPYCHPG